MADPSGSGEPVPAPTCDRATQEALEALGRLQRAVRKMTEEMATIYTALGSARPPLPPQEISPEMVRAAIMAYWEDEEGDDISPLAMDAMKNALVAALRVRGEPSRSKVLVCPDCDGTEHVAGSDGATPFCVECEDVEMGWTYRRRATDHEPEAVRGEPSREPTLEEIVRETIAEHYRTWRGWKGAQGTAPFNEESMTDLTEKVRARLSSPEAPRSTEPNPPSTWPLESHVQETPPLRGRLHE